MVFSLLALRRKGITTLAEGQMYLKLNQLHQENKKQLKIFRTKPQFNWKSNKDFEVIPKYFKKRGCAAPLDILGMPGYEKLTEKEKDMCSSVRLVPATYLDLKEVLVNENSRAGFVKLQKARSMLKIDVNKTRRLYDFLVAESYIKK